MSNINNGGLDQYGAEPFQQQQFETTGAEGVNIGKELRGTGVTTLLTLTALLTTTETLCGAYTEYIASSLRP